MTLVIVILLAIVLALGAASDPTSGLPLPLVVWHGLGDTYDAAGLQSVGDLAQEVNPGTYVFFIRVANASSSDRRATFFGNVTEQLAAVCDDIANHPVLSKSDAVNALGFSQGGQFLRGYVERCNNPPVRNLVTFGSQHNGISKFQGCGATDWLCKGAESLLNANTWSGFAQRTLVPAQYFKDPEDLSSYLNHSNFLADINNERDNKNTRYKDGITALKKFVMYVFEKDVTVQPKESGWFASKNMTSEVITPLKESLIYKEDWLGLKELDEKEGLVFKTAPGAHMQLTDKVLKETFKEYFSPDATSSLPQDL